MARLRPVKRLGSIRSRLSAFAKDLASPYFWQIVFMLGAVTGAAITCVICLAVPPSNYGLVVPVVAAGIAASALVVTSLTYMFNWRKSKTDLFIAVHEKLIAPEVQSGRKILADKVSGVMSVRLLSDHEFESANRSLALYDTLAMYSRRGSVIPADVEETWGLAMRMRSDQIRDFITYRALKDEYHSWPHLTAMLNDLENNPLK